MAILIDKPLQVSKDHFQIKIDIGTSISYPGQFANIKIGNTDPLLRRPFSIYDHNDNIIDIIFRVVGKGTEILKNITEAGYIDVISPLGHGFSITENKKVLLVGGGVGNAPLHYLARKLKSRKNTIQYLYAARSKEYIYNKNDYESISDKLYITTDDGSEGQKGLATEAAEDLISKNNYDIIYTCGPEIMMKNLAAILKEKNIRFEVSVENYFGCGIGLCSGCTVNTKSGLMRACIDGPVFDGNIISWE